MLIPQAPHVLVTQVLFSTKREWNERTAPSTTYTIPQRSPFSHEPDETLTEENN